MPRLAPILSALAILTMVAVSAAATAVVILWPQGVVAAASQL